ncbi:TBK1-like protein [Mya arenaria]|uniref:TBK1-like protein n=1 Tax=Mya arenaria TaxID=6604 RepID=A0ABY7FYF3_MYAAR|nr:TBK1-like protein [Mya arenaria]
MPRIVTIMKSEQENNQFKSRIKMSLRGSGGFLWDVTKPLGQGATSMVYKGRNKSTGEEVAVKVFSQAAHMRPAEVQMREFVVMKKLTHRNIVPLLAIEEEQGTNNKVIVMQLTEHGSLYNMLEEPNNAYGLPEEEFLIVFDHVTAGMKYMRDNGIVHRDIKPGNILRYIGEDGRSIYKLTDFGAAKQVENDEEQFMSLYGTEEYLFTSKVDLWSLGVSFFHVATGMLPFKPYGGRKNREKMFEITRHKESGMIMGVQHTEGGAIEWSRVKHLITPIFARLLEADPHKVWNFDELFLNVEGIIRKRVIHVFCSHTWRCLKVYIDSNKKGVSKIPHHIPIRRLLRLEAVFSNSVRELRMINLLTDTNDSELHSICLELTQFYESSRQSTDEESKKITELSYQVQSLLSKLQEDQLNKKHTAKVQVVVEQILKIKQQFSENRRKTSLSFNDEQIHKYEKQFEKLGQSDSLMSQSVKPF